MPHSNKKVEVKLTAAQRKQLEALCRKGTTPAAKLRYARALLLADEDRREGHKPDWRVSEIVGISLRQICRIRQQFAREGLAPTLERKARCQPGTTPKFDGKAEARLVALCCSDPPDGRQRWTLQLLVDELSRLKVITSVCPETVRKTLKKIGSSPGVPSGFAFPTETAPASLPTWRKSSMSTRKHTTRHTR